MNCEFQYYSKFVVRYFNIQHMSTFRINNIPLRYEIFSNTINILWQFPFSEKSHQFLQAYNYDL